MVYINLLIIDAFDQYADSLYFGTFNAIVLHIQANIGIYTISAVLKLSSLGDGIKKTLR